MIARYNILKLDHDAVVSEVNELKSTNQKPEEATQETIRNLEAECDSFKNLYQANRTNECIIEDRVKKAVKAAEAT
jgi:hypothetical protein